MSTRSIIARTDSTTFDGIYCHFDGYPSAMAPALAAIVTRDGHDAVGVLTGTRERHEGGTVGDWTSIAEDMPSATTELPYPTFQEYIEHLPHGEQSDPGIRSLYTALGMGDDATARARVTEGYGYAGPPGGGISFSGRVRGRPDTAWCEWVYLLNDDLTLSVYEPGERGLVRAARFTHRQLAALHAGDKSMLRRVEAAECGQGYSRCSHYAWAHEKDVPKESAGLSMRQWLALDPLSPRDAIGAIENGRRYEFTGSSSSRNGMWLVAAKGQEAKLPVCQSIRGELTPLPGVELIYPPTKMQRVV